MNMRSTVLLVVVAAAAAFGAQSPQVDVTGAWTFTVQSDAGTSMPNVTFKQAGEKLTGHYSSMLVGEAELTGTIKGETIEFTVRGEVQGFALELKYSGTLDGKDSIRASYRRRAWAAVVSRRDASNDTESPSSTWRSTASPVIPTCHAACHWNKPWALKRKVEESRMKGILLIAGGAGAVLVMIVIALVQQHAGRQVNSSELPTFEPDPLWAQNLPNKWVNGQVGGVAVDSHDNLWVFHRPATIPDGEKAASLNPPQAECCIPAPPVLEFDTNGKFLQAWGGPGQGYEWPSSEHGIFVDPKDNVWLSGNAKEDNQILKFTKDGKFLMQIGHAGKNRGSNDTENLGGPAGLFVYPKTNELFVADGYFNRRVIVFDADTGAYKRHWGAYGKKPDDSLKLPARAQLSQATGA